MLTYEYGNPASPVVLIQMVDDHGLEVMESEVEAIQGAVDSFKLVAIKVNSWNRDLSLWKAPAVFGKEDFGGCAAETLTEVLKLCTDGSKTYFLGGYSLSGLFALWAAYQTKVFAGIAAASLLVWFPGFAEFMKGHVIHSGTVYLSLGDKEESVKSQVMSKVGDCIREGYARLTEQGINCTLEWNQGNHFRQPDIRTAKAFVWVMKNYKESNALKEELIGTPVCAKFAQAQKEGNNLQQIG